MKQIIAAVTLAFSFNAVYANCGNDKQVGKGCSPADTTPIVATTPVNNTIGVTNGNTFTGSLTANNTADSRSGAVANAIGGGSVSTNTNSNQANGGTAAAFSTSNGGNAVATNTANGGQGGTGGKAVATNIAANTATNTATGGTSNATGGQGGNAVATNTATGGNVQGNVNSNSEINISNNTTTNVPRPAAASAVAPNTIFSGGMDSCMGSTTGSVQGLSFGVAVGSTWTDSHCVALRAAVRLNELGFKNTAAARLCAIPEIKEAFAKSKEFDCGE